MEILIIAVIIGLLPAFIAKSKGGNFFLWWLYGAAIFIVALPHSLIMKSSRPEAGPVMAPASQLCRHCGKYYDGTPSFCPNCGKALSEG